MTRDEIEVGETYAVGRPSPYGLTNLATVLGFERLSAGEFVRVRFLDEAQTALVRPSQLSEVEDEGGDEGSYNRVVGGPS